MFSNWRLHVAIGFTLGILMSYGLYSVTSYFTKLKHAKELTSLEETLTAKCAEDQKKVQGVSNEYQKKLTSTTAKLNAALRRLHNNQTASNDRATSGYNATSGDGRLYYSDPAGAVPSLERAAIATKQAEQLIACQNFIREERR
jgi:hypothetical protein